jgi:hypothetical protein
MSVLRGGGGVDLLEHAQAAGVFVLEEGFLGAAGGAEGAEERGGAGGLSASGVPASRRHSALAGSANQQ